MKDAPYVDIARRFQQALIDKHNTIIRNSKSCKGEAGEVVNC